MRPEDASRAVRHLQQNSPLGPLVVKSVKTKIKNSVADNFDRNRGHRPPVSLHPKA